MGTGIFFLRNAISVAILSGVPTNTIILLLLLPLVASVIAGARHIVGIRGFGIFLPAALSVVFVATGPLVGIGLFLLIVTISTVTRLTFRRLKLKLQYLPRMAIIIWFVIVGVLVLLFLSPLLPLISLANISVFAVLIVALLAEDFTRVQLGKSAKTALSLTSETIILSLVSYLIFTNKTLGNFALANPELLLSGVLIFNLILGKYVGLRILEYWRFRKLIFHK